MVIIIVGGLLYYFYFIYFFNIYIFKIIIIIIFNYYFPILLFYGWGLFIYYPFFFFFFWHTKDLSEHGCVGAVNLARTSLSIFPPSRATSSKFGRRRRWGVSRSLIIAFRKLCNIKAAAAQC